MVDLNLFNEKFGTEEKCRDFLVRNRWPYGFRCPVCGGGHYYYVQTRHIYECQCCRTQTSITSGTLFHGTRLPLQYWFLTMYLLSNDVPCSARWLSMNLQLHYRTASRLLRSVRECMKRCNEYWTNRLIEHIQTGNRKETDGVGVNKGLLRELQLSIEEDEGKKAAIGYVNQEEQRQLQEGHAMDEPAASASEGASGQIAADAIVSPAVDRAWKLMADRISAFIRSRYRKVQRRYLKSYMEEFYFRWSAHDTRDRFWRLARTSTEPFLPASA